MRVDIVTKEYPPEVYGGAGVHVTELVKALRTAIEVEVRAFGADRDEQGTTSYGVPTELSAANAAIQTLGTDPAADWRVVPGDDDPAAFRLVATGVDLHLRSSLPGGFNVLNTAMAAAALVLLG